MKRVLIADDEPVVRSIVRMALESDRYELVEAADGWETLSQVHSAQPDVILLDIMMPGLDGLAVCRALKGNPDTAGITVIMLTAKAAGADISEGYETGADFYITKPFAPDALLALVERALGLTSSASPARGRTAAGLE